MVRACEEAGVRELWLWEDCFLEGGLTTAAAALAWSEQLRVGVGLLPVPLRNPALTAMELATVARLWPGRLVATLGHGVADWMAQVGGAVASPMTLLREHAGAVHDLLHGATVDVDGRYVSLREVALDWPPTTPPTLLVGGRGPRTVTLAGEVADGVLLDAAVDSPEDVRRARGQVDEGRSRSRRDSREGQQGQEAGRAQVVVYTELDPAAPDLAALVAERAATLAEAGADTVVLQATAEHPDPRPLIEAIAAR